MNEEKLRELQEEIERLGRRDKEVELEAKWQDSWMRRVAIGVLTYVVVVLFMIAVGSQGNVFLNAAVPAIAYILSTFSLDIIKRFCKGNKRKA